MHTAEHYLPRITTANPLRHARGKSQDAARAENPSSASAKLFFTPALLEKTLIRSYERMSVWTDAGDAIAKTKMWRFSRK